MISGIILSDVASSDRGANTAVKRTKEEKFLRRIVSVLHSARVMDVVIVGGEKEKNTSGQLNEIGVKLAFNPSPQSGEITSIQVGIENIRKDDVHGIMICPIDHPLITQKLLVNLMQGFWHSQKNIVVPIYKGARGYPVIFGKGIFDVLRDARQEIKATEIMHDYQNEIREINTEEEGAVLTISSLEEYQKYSGGLKNA